MNNEEIARAEAALRKATQDLAAVRKAETERTFSEPVPMALMPTPQPVVCAKCGKAAAVKKVWDTSKQQDAYHYIRPAKSDEPLCEYHLQDEDNPYQFMAGKCDYCGQPYANGHSHSLCYRDY